MAFGRNKECVTKVEVVSPSSLFKRKYIVQFCFLMLWFLYNHVCFLFRKHLFRSGESAQTGKNKKEYLFLSIQKANKEWITNDKYWAYLM